MANGLVCSSLQINTRIRVVDFVLFCKTTLGRRQEKTTRQDKASATRRVSLIINNVALIARTRCAISYAFQLAMFMIIMVARAELEMIMLTRRDIFIQ